MASTLGLPFLGTTAYPYSYNADALLDELSRHMFTSPAARKVSRGSNGQRSGTAMRITKPSSASNSPRSSMNLYRRRTVLNDGGLAAQRSQHVADHVVTPPIALMSADLATDVPAPRPVSWHPASSHYQQPPIQLGLPPTEYQDPAYSRVHGVDAFSPYHHHMSPMTASHSCHTSPSTFSPLSLPLNDVTTTQNGGHHEVWSLQHDATPSYVSPELESRLGYAESFPALSSAASSSDGSRSSSTTEWNSFVLHGFDGRTTSPPTPENLPQVPEPKTAVLEESIPYQPLVQPEEEEGEILVGMGLYDAPDKYDAYVSLSNYRSTVSSLFGGNRGKESPGKGLKLEETWEPPESEDDDDDDDDDEDDAQEEAA